MCNAIKQYSKEALYTLINIVFMMCWLPLLVYLFYYFVCWVIIQNPVPFLVSMDIVIRLYSLIFPVIVVFFVVLELLLFVSYLVCRRYEMNTSESKIISRAK
ncbi:hypothetical protein S010_004434 [Salmonella enterica subsp. enterica serovar Oranienburg]|uniref:hypothetical protein n=1 Tax=Salmonella enterica TaxID=28901 RepID=UPI0008FD19F6|nr:hypothetical protein [Salmonella enterica]EAP3745693.1 hypothetical protein [Salmonella enterica subsp. enterica serovar Minnesota]EBP4092207.1 hypothetical protein [Salmonella enterica subsp. enterica]EBZ1620791.1 hypothetical protein [Salmonella enterica subsp. enterica serovar Pomona]ECG6284520.1 hypothetical protein [Salmonella enterica subsp. enterica serovar Panama]ECX5681043.1 hypothetical protein [Salmonella enterica subsp. enterica serovar Newport]EDS4256296.1 hypothetical protein